VHVKYFHVPPAHPLSGAVVGMFRLQAHGAYATETILPKGIIDILFNLGPPIRTRSQDGSVVYDDWNATIVSGLRTQTVVSEPHGAVSTFGAAVRPEAAFSLLGVPLEDLTNATVDGAAIFPDADVILNRLGETTEFEDQCQALLAWLQRRRRVDAKLDMMVEACRVLRRPAGPGGVARAAAAVGVSERQLHRLFVHRLGLRPTEYAQLARFARAVPLISTSGPLVNVALEAGYFDQAHFCRDFRALAGMTPDAYRQGRPAVAGHIFSTKLSD
jgi:AraC-like DNA-binding protein